MSIAGRIMISMAATVPRSCMSKTKDWMPKPSISNWSQWNPTYRPLLLIYKPEKTLRMKLKRHKTQSLLLALNLPKYLPCGGELKSRNLSIGSSPTRSRELKNSLTRPWNTYRPTTSPLTTPCKKLWARNRRRETTRASQITMAPTWSLRTSITAIRLN